MREATWRRRNMARRIGTRNQSWIAVAEPADSATNAAVIQASLDEAMPISSRIGANTTAIDAEHGLDLGDQHGARVDRRGDDEVVRVLAGDGEPGEAAGQLAGGHDQHRHDHDEGAGALAVD